MVESTAVFLTDFADSIGETLVLHYYPNRGKLWTAEFRSYGINLDVQRGIGQTPTQALNDYARKIAGKTVVFRPLAPTERREITAPMRLCYDD